MSYIHEALKKAQKEKDTRRGEYNWVLSTNKKRPRIQTGRIIRVACLGLIILFLAFGAYSWLNPKTPATTKVIDHKRERPKPPPRKKPVIDPRKIYDRARALHMAGRLADARRLYLETIKVNPDYIDALNNLGVIYIYDKNYPAASSVLERATRLKPRNVDPFYNLACLYAIKGEQDQSLAYLRKAISIHQPAGGWARKDTDLKSLWELPAFQKITKK